MKKNDSITISRETLFALAPAMVIISIIISKHRPGDLLLFVIGLISGAFIYRSIK